MTMVRRISLGVGLMLALAAVGCDKSQLLAPTKSTVTLSAASRTVSTGGSTEVSAAVIESSGTPVQNGTVVRFTTSLGRVDPVEAQTRNGIAVTTFFAGNDSGVAEVRGTSGGVGGTTTTPAGGTTTTTDTNVVMISVGSGAVDTVTVRANPSVVSSNGGTVAVVALVVGTNGRLLQNVPVTFTATRGTLSATTAVTDAAGEARVTLTTNADTDITATAGSKTSAVAKVTAQAGPAVTLTCAVGTATNCATATQGQAVTFTASRGTTTSVITSATLDFGDGTSIDLGTLASPVTVSHTYSQAGAVTARLTATDVNGETTSATQIVQVGGAVTATVTAPTPSTKTVTATATVTGANVSQYAWTFEGTGPNTTTTGNTASYTYSTSGSKTISVIATLTDGRTVSASTSVVVP